ncbi:hypothetical protein [Maritimibacter dapengensis]|uniref:Poly-beta-1,6-N-acetyl-D-glucosamine biosynthesis protein PgaD n=1 Tax=Maritimibacter dapengensis TaxID=2836868 RepID=A0ABS6T074_9RHOB|nr:hypothetical protein [Maritimibacter dapengensis]MBV7378640.1 hypothetical protein [Maritimibacter dapengensis]
MTGKVSSDTEAPQVFNLEPRRWLSGATFALWFFWYSLAPLGTLSESPADLIRAATYAPLWIPGSAILFLAYSLVFWTAAYNLTYSRKARADACIRLTREYVDFPVLWLAPKFRKRVPYSDISEFKLTKNNRYSWPRRHALVLKQRRSTRFGSYKWRWEFGHILWGTDNVNRMYEVISKPVGAAKSDVSGRTLSSSQTH